MNKETLNEFISKKLNEKHALKVEHMKNIKNEKNINNIKGKIAFALALVMGLPISMFSSCKKTKNDDLELPSTSEVILADNIELVNPNILGFSMKTLEKNKNFTVVSGNINVEEITKDSNGVVWATKEDANRAKDIGKTVIDDKNGKYEIKTDKNTGKVKVYDKDVSYEIKDEEGNTRIIEEGSNGIPKGYHESQGEIIKEGYVIASKDYYGVDTNGNKTVIISKGDAISEDTEKRAEKELYNSKEEVPELITKVEEEVITFSDEEIKKRIEEELNKKGLSGNADEAVKVGESSKIEEKEETTTNSLNTNNSSSSKNIKNESTVVEETTTIVEEKTIEETTTIVEEKTIEETTTIVEETKDDGIINSDGTYSIYGMKFKTKSDYQQWVIQGYEGYGMKNGIMVPEDNEMKNAYDEYQKTLSR